MDWSRFHRSASRRGPTRFQLACQRFVAARIVLRDGVTEEATDRFYRRSTAWDVARHCTSESEQWMPRSLERPSTVDTKCLLRVASRACAALAFDLARVARSAPCPSRASRSVATNASRSAAVTSGRAASCASRCRSTLPTARRIGRGARSDAAPVLNSCGS
jgi:hypothetical protein